ncbi:cation:proton antiporter [Clostridium paraputrificum]|uniref:cation:proton antiporter n=1 Tax=Clostridium TaxID=1485 RepID=UPI000C07C187|nr:MULTISPECIES: cation:proton antiporter [Clostridium]MDB2074708.1 cation:proton antiporter [Clostridium paraputrificum]MDB2079359.1 cation:proton antiporter [Clostridium paraputrificum]MDB2085333.1 cation:proton antiporter [Clostridium paraputrificum]MDB2099910.1 cation:proton antiporter [Clostridium paraputrificum]MDU1031418.1 cation:proton antiporter [Clostridium sp.]
MISLILRLVVTIIIAFFIGKLVSKFKLPAILGWLITGMILGPHALSIVNETLLDANWYNTFIHVLECAVGLLIGTELVWNKIKKTGKQIVITTLTQSLGTFILVSLAFGVIFYFTGIPIYLGIIFGGIALATAPAPALSIVREFKTDGPVTKTLIPMAALDDIVAVIVFFSSISIISAGLSEQKLPAYMIALVILLPLIIGVATGLLAGIVLKKERNKKETLALLIIMIIFASAIGFFFNNYVMPKPVLNFMLIGMAFSATFSNMISEKRLEEIMNNFNPILGFSMIVVILNLGAPLNYHLILNAGLYTAIYIIIRALGKYFGAYFGASITKSPETVKKYLGLTLLPHSGVSLVFTGIAVSVLSNPAPECAQIIQGTIAAAAVINEIIAVIIAKKGFELAGEFNKNCNIQNDNSDNLIAN